MSSLLKQPRGRKAEAEELTLTPTEAAKLLRISTVTLRKLTNEGKVPHLRIGDRTVRFERETLLRHLAK